MTDSYYELIDAEDPRGEKSVLSFAEQRPHRGADDAGGADDRDP